jgi:hypothetical protein
MWDGTSAYAEQASQCPIAFAAARGHIGVSSSRRAYDLAASIGFRAAPTSPNSMHIFRLPSDWTEEVFRIHSRIMALRIWAHQLLPGFETRIAFRGDHDGFPGAQVSSLTSLLFLDHETVEAAQIDSLFRLQRFDNCGKH